MPSSFFIIRFLRAFAVATVAIVLGQYLKGHPFVPAALDGLLWGAITAAVYTGVLAWKLRDSACIGPRE
jgi:hypothetical protein